MPSDLIHQVHMPHGWTMDMPLIAKVTNLIMSYICIVFVYLFIIQLSFFVRTTLTYQHPTDKLKQINLKIEIQTIKSDK